MTVTRVFVVDPNARETELLTAPAIREAAAILRRGGLVAFPTETVYGLGAVATDARAVANLFAAKGRPADNPLIVHLAAAEDVVRVARDIPPEAWRLWARYAPGPLTLVLPSRGTVAPAALAGLPTVAVRIPAHPVARALIRAAGAPIVAPSANRSGRPSPTTAAHVLEDLAGRIDAVVDGGPADIGLESTVLDVTRRPAIVLRPGAVTVEMLEAVLGDGAVVDPAAPLRDGEAPRSPGMKYRHYAPDVPLALLDLEDGAEAAVEALRAVLAVSGPPPAVIATEEDAARLRALLAAAGVPSDRLLWVIVGRRSEPQTVAAALYGAFRSLRPEAASRAFFVRLPETGLFRAVMNRVRKAAGDRRFPGKDAAPAAPE
ncbi:MAG: threonylcarbamoyl-AMP synthase [Hydrogenibacillus schlegelii]|nr:threonylcarbamoyl-AMP synthase [Hydrogenibacillus schlegelii]